MGRGVGDDMPYCHLLREYVVNIVKKLNLARVRTQHLFLEEVGNAWGSSYGDCVGDPPGLILKVMGPIV